MVSEYSMASTQGAEAASGGPVVSPRATDLPIHSPVPPPTPSSGIPRPKQKLIYILGTGRCGSTVFEIVLGSHPKVQATGEFHGIPFPKWMPGTICACGQTFNLCPFWSPIREEYQKYVDFDQQLESQGRFEYYRCLPRALIHRVFGSSDLRRHAKGMADLIRVISQRSGKEVVSDSSKSAARGYAYTRARAHDLDVYFIHLVRDGRGYMYSKTTVPDGAGYGKKRLVRNPWEITLRWVAPNLAARLLCSRPKNRYMRIRYEDFIEHPVETLERVGQFVGLDMTPVIETVRSGKPIPVGHLIGGNRLRFQPTITLETRYAKVDLGTRQSRWAFWTLGGWMAYWYGYPRHGRGSDRPGTSG
jgi:hypothetical protein